MISLTGLVVPAWARVALVAALVAAVFAVGWFKGNASKQRDWDRAVLQEREDAVKLAAIQNRKMAQANAAYAAGRDADARREASIRDAVSHRCGVVLPAGSQLRGPDNPAPVPAVPGRGARAPAEAERDEAGGVAGLTAAEIAEDEAVICPALYRRASWLIGLAKAAGADKD